MVAGLPRRRGESRPSPLGSSPPSPRGTTLHRGSRRRRLRPGEMPIPRASSAPWQAVAMAERLRPGYPARDPYDIIDYREVITAAGVDRIPVRVIDRVVETIQVNAFIHDAASRAGIATETLRQWRRRGVEASADLLEGRKRRSDLDTLTKRCVELAARMEKAEAEARVLLLGAITQLARGGMEQTRTVEKVDASTGDVLERVEERRKLLPDTRAITWLLANRYPADFVQRVEITGPEGGPVQVESARDRLMTAIEGVRERRPIDVASRPKLGNGETGNGGPNGG